MSTAAPVGSHDDQVVKRINKYIDIVNSTLSNENAAKKLEEAWSLNIKERETDAASSVATVGRDADYYFAARHSVAAEKNPAMRALLAAGGSLVVTPFYNLLKVGALVGEKLFREAHSDAIADAIRDKMRSKAGLPNAPPGGQMWEFRGAADGVFDDSDSIAPLLRYGVQKQPGGMGDRRTFRGEKAP
jgi:hypothetical protein